MVFSPKELNKAYYDLSDSISKNTFTILYGGRGSSKTHSLYQVLLKKLWNEEGTNAVFFRNVGLGMKEKAFNPFMAICKQKGVEKSLKANFYSDVRNVHFPKGNRLVFDHIGADGGERSKGYAGFNLVVVDEINQCREEDIMTLITSFRSEKATHFVFMFNPVSEMHWLKKVFFDNVQEGSIGSRTAKYHYTYKDNKFVNQDYIDTLEGLKFTDQQKYKVECLGQWGVIQTNNPFFTNFNYNLHVCNDEIPFFKEYKVCLSWDFGLDEHLVVSQHFKDYEIAVDERLQKYFKPTTNGVIYRDELSEGSQESFSTGMTNIGLIAEKVIRKYGIDAEYEIIGDSAGLGRIGKFTVIREEFLKRGAEFLDFPSLNKKPTHHNSRSHCDWVFSNYRSNFKVSVTCPRLINDLTVCRCDMYGGIDKVWATNNNVCHFSDALRYDINQFELESFHSNYLNMYESTMNALPERGFANYQVL
jgi:phage terminase large subunit